MEHILNAINLCVRRENEDVEDFCKTCPYNKYNTEDSKVVCVDELLLDAKTLIMNADRRLTTVQKMCTEWTMNDLRDSVLRETILWDKCKWEYR